MGLRGIENGVTRFDRVQVPAGDLHRPGEGKGLKIALTTLNTGRLSHPRRCASRAPSTASDCAGMVAGPGPVGPADRQARGRRTRRSPSSPATTFALEAVVELCGHDGRRGRRDIRIEAALAKLYATEMAWLIADELVQIRGGRGFETAQSLARAGNGRSPAEQMLRDLRINRIFEGSSEIMQLLIAREAVDSTCGRRRVVEPGGPPPRRRKTAPKATGYYGVAARARGRQRSPARGRTPSLARSPPTSATPNAFSAGSPAATSTRWPAGRRAGAKAGDPRPRSWT